MNVKLKRFALLLILLILLCISTTVSNGFWKKAARSEKDFVVSINTDSFPKVSVLVTYKGNRETLKIYHSSPYVGAVIYDKDGNLIGESGADTVMQETVFVNGETQNVDFDIYSLVEKTSELKKKGCKFEAIFSYSLEETSDEIEIYSSCDLPAAK